MLTRHRQQLASKTGAPSEPIASLLQESLSCGCLLLLARKKVKGAVSDPFAPLGNRIGAGARWQEVPMFRSLAVG